MRSSFVTKVWSVLRAGALVAPWVAMADLRESGVVDEERTVVSGGVSSYMWILNDGDVKNDRGQEDSDSVLTLYGARVGYHDYGYMRSGGDIHKTLGMGLNTWGASYDASLSVGLRTGRDKFGTVYGADFALSMPVGAAGETIMRSLSSRGSRIFARSVLGELSLGYQEGVETVMKVDVLGRISGAAVGSSWSKYTRYFQKFTNGVPFHVHPGLYSEHLLRMEESLARPRGHSMKFVDVLSSMPSRVNYVSPKMRGVTFGLSYALTGDARDLHYTPAFEVVDAVSQVKRGSAAIISDGSRSVEAHTRKVLALVTPRFDSKPEYNNILSAALRYELGASRKNMAAVLSAEYAKRSKLRDVLPGGYDYSGAGWLVEYNDLAAVSTGVEATYSGVRGALAVGLLGQSGKPQSYVKMDRKGEVVEGTRRRVPYAQQRGNSFYVVTSLSYTDGPVTASLGYYMSRLNYNPVKYVPRNNKIGDFISPFDGMNELHDVVIGLGYNVYRKGSATLETFLNCHLYATKQHYREYRLQKGVHEFRLGSKGTTKSTGAVVLMGLKFTF